MRRHLLAAAVGALVLAACATNTTMPTATSEPVDLARFMGTWHVIAHVPYFGERGHVASTDSYTLKPDGGIAVRYDYQTGFGQPRKSLDSRATVKAGTGNHDWTTWFFGVIPTRYRILEVAPDYDWALIGYPGRDLAWVFSRTPQMDDAQYQALLERMRGHGVTRPSSCACRRCRRSWASPGLPRPRTPEPHPITSPFLPPARSPA